MSEGHKRILRFGILERIEHFVLILSFTTLGLTGLPQKYALNPISQAVIEGLGGIETIRIIHRIAATIFLLEAIYHVIILGYKLYVQRKEATMVPGIKDGKDAIQQFGYNLGLWKIRPKMPRYNFTEKMEYLAMLWGLVLMGLTGLMLWNPIATTNVLPGEFIPAAKAAHGAEAVLAVLAILIWHFYNVHIKQWNWGMIKGTLSRHEYEEEHGEELEKIESGMLPPAPAPEQRRKRLTLFAPIASVATVALVAVTVYFLTFEQSAITTVPPISDVPVYLRATPTITVAPVKPSTGTGTDTGGAASWAVVGPMLADKCSGCHGSTGGFSAESYESVMEKVTPGDPDASKIVEVMKGDHPANLSEEELQTLIDWIKAGATNEGAQEGTQGTDTGTGTEAGAAPTTWDGGIGALFEDSCAACHGSAGGFSAESYSSVMEQVKAGDPDGSKVVEVQKAGHPGQFSEADLQAVIDWITAGAPEK